ncbi:MAG: radical SAM protein [Candidatus Wallbacteria bacterium]|nr:radical SAM protein [Candidatus Wallbacteria bacterium]
MKLLFLSPFAAPTKNYYRSIHQGLGILAAMAVREGHQAEIRAFSDLNELEPVLSCDYDYALLTTFSNQLGLVRETLGFLGKRGVKTVLGGVHATFAPEDFLDLPFEYLVRGEGEGFFQEFLKTPGNLSGYKGVITGGRKPVPDFAPLCLDLDSNPFPMRYLEPPDKARNIIGFEVLSTRGCHYDCTYCSAPAYAGAYHGYYRRRSVGNVVAEILEAGLKYPLIGFHDDHFLADERWLQEFLEIYPSRVGKPFWCNSRVEAINTGIVDKMKRAGLIRVHLGIEAGSFETRKNLLNRNLTDEQIISAFQILKKAGIMTVGFSILGLPDETEDSLWKLVELNRRAAPDRAHYSLFQPYPGTYLAGYCRDRKIRVEFSESYYRWEKIPDLPGISSERLKYFLDNFISLIYLKPGKIAGGKGKK